MTYYPDLSPYEYYQAESSTVNIGWLDAVHKYPQGAVPDEFIERLWAFCCSPVHQSKGFHACELCRKPVFGLTVHRGNNTIQLGSAEIRVFGKDGTVYAAPDLIYHYVIEHHYRPPDQFIQAVMESPLPCSSAYEVLLNQSTRSPETHS